MGIINIVGWVMFFTPLVVGICGIAYAAWADREAREFLLVVSLMVVWILIAIKLMGRS